MNRQNPAIRGRGRRGRLLPASAPTRTKGLRSGPGGVSFLSVENRAALFGGITATTGRVSGIENSGNVDPVQTGRQPVSPPPLDPLAEENNPLETPTKAAAAIKPSETLKDLQPILERWLTTELEARIPSYVERVLSIRYDAIFAKRTDESVRKAIVTLSRSIITSEPLTDSIRPEVDASLHREEASSLHGNGVATKATSPGRN